MQALESHCLSQQQNTMLIIELVPDLSHCIETVAKREYQETIKRLLSAPEMSEKLQEKAEILSLFLQTADFKKLRSEYEKYLTGGQKVKFMIYLENGASMYNIEEV